MSTTREKRLPRMLVVDDESEQCLALADMFAPEFRVSTALSIAEARKNFSLDAFDIAIVDYHLPGESGAALLTELSHYLPESRLFMYTADAATESPEHQDWRHISKAVSADELMHFIRVGMRSYGRWRPKPSASNDMGSTRPKLLVVDDEPDQCAALKELFSGTFDVHTALSAAEASEKYDFDAFAVAIVDWHMPNESGMNLARILSRHIPSEHVFLFTADEAAQAQEGESFRYVSKASEPEALESVIAEAVRGTNMRRVARLARSFPTFSLPDGPRNDTPGLSDTFDATSFGQDLNGWSPCESTTAKFLQYVAAPQGHTFELASLKLWDAPHRVAFAAWAKDPFWGT